MFQQTFTIEAPAVFKPLDQPSGYKGLHGGRGSGKSWHDGHYEHSGRRAVHRC